MNLKNPPLTWIISLPTIGVWLGWGVGGWEELIIYHPLNFINLTMMFGSRRVFHGEVVHWIILFAGS